MFVGNLYENSEGDLEFVSDNGVWYDLQDARTNRSNKSYDLVHVLVDIGGLMVEYDVDIWEQMIDSGIDDYVGRMYGSSFLFDPELSDDPFAFKDQIKSLDNMVKSYESKNPDIVKIFSEFNVPFTWELVN